VSETVSSADESVQLYKLLRWGLMVEIPIVAITSVSAVLASSAALVALAAQSGIALVINAFAVYAMRQVLKHNVYSHPYGAGKLENFSAFLCGVLYIPSGLYVLFDSVERLIHAPEVGYITGLIPVAITFSTGAVFFVLATKLMRRTKDPSPLLIAYKADYFIGMMTDGGVLVAFVVGTLLVGTSLGAVGDRIDPAVALVMACYMIWIGVELVRNNFRALMDLPLPEEHQLTITRVLAGHFSDYDRVGTLYTRSSGNRRFVEIELGFDGDRTVEHVHVLSRHMERDLAEQVPGLRFRIVPVWGSEEPAAPGEGADEAAAEAAVEAAVEVGAEAGAEAVEPAFQAGAEAPAGARPR
jgi:cation diffusion facilitator family transporter